MREKRSSHGLNTEETRIASGLCTAFCVLCVLSRQFNEAELAAKRRTVRKRRAVPKRFPSDSQTFPNAPKRSQTIPFPILSLIRFPLNTRHFPASCRAPPLAIFFDHSAAKERKERERKCRAIVARRSRQSGNRENAKGRKRKIFFSQFRSFAISRSNFYRPNRPASGRAGTMHKSATRGISESILSAF